jgi:hypothetical protein
VKVGNTPEKPEIKKPSIKQLQPDSAVQDVMNLPDTIDKRRPAEQKQ